MADGEKRGLGRVRLQFIARPEPNAIRLRILAVLEMKPDEANHVTLDPGRRDSFGNPGAHLSITPCQADRETLAHSDRLVRKVVSDLKLDEVSFTRKLGWTSHHHMGGCRMGDDPRTSVVDGNLKVHGTTNLYVAGSAPFVTCGVSFPTLTIGALSLRLADHLAKRIQKGN